MDQSIAAFKNNLAKIRTGRANPQLLDTIHVEYYGSMVPLSQVANVALLDARTISVQPWEKNMGAKIEKAIRESDLGLNPASMGDLIRVPMPPMSEERRKEMTKRARSEGEGAKWYRDKELDLHAMMTRRTLERMMAESTDWSPEADEQAIIKRLAEGY